MADLKKIIVDWQQNFPILKSYSPSTIFMNADCFLIGLIFISHYAHHYTVQFEWIPLWDNKKKRRGKESIIQLVYLEN